MVRFGSNRRLLLGTLRAVGLGSQRHLTRFSRELQEALSGVIL